jgi:cytochrome c peroxidase
MMHNGVPDLGRVINHYNVINPAQNTNLDPRLAPNRIGQKLNLTQAESAAIIAFLQTLTGTNLYTDKKWSDPFL